MNSLHHYISVCYEYAITKVNLLFYSNRTYCSIAIEQIRKDNISNEQMKKDLLRSREIFWQKKIEITFWKMRAYDFCVVSENERASATNE